MRASSLETLYKASTMHKRFGLLVFLSPGALVSTLLAMPRYVFPTREQFKRHCMSSRSTLEIVQQISDVTVKLLEQCWLKMFVATNIWVVVCYRTEMVKLPRHQLDLLVRCFVAQFLEIRKESIVKSRRWDVRPIVAGWLQGHRLVLALDWAGVYK